MITKNLQQKILQLKASDKMYLIIVIILSFIGWASTARIIRGMAISLRENEFVSAAKSLGMGNIRP